MCLCEKRNYSEKNLPKDTNTNKIEIYSNTAKSREIFCGPLETFWGSSDPSLKNPAVEHSAQ